ncbi:MAG: ribosome biogenesis GTP-binding protein YihA/YsxC [Mycoplasmoidaceae bacterium]|nr:MAG: ribosome biogenesis GTP-binding protein YihA/YsxC [Mycoplasmoidaceae bacterium]
MAKFIKSAFTPDQWIKDSKTEFCFIGRSNVGKSTLINAMARENIAITSKTPGRTRLVNFFDFGTFRIIDLPGYGFANASKGQKDDITDVIDNYLVSRTNLYGIFQICDAGVLTEMDKKMSDYFKKRFVNHFIILNKVDKIGEKKVVKELPKISKYLNIDSKNIFMVSAKKNDGINNIFSTISKVLKDIGITHHK